MSLQKIGERVTVSAQDAAIGKFSETPMVVVFV
jgi:hypothetical protein